MRGDEAVQPLDRPCGPSGERGGSLVAERSEELDSRLTARGDVAVRLGEVPGGEPLRLSHRREQRFGRRILERKERHVSVPVEPSGDTRREAAQPSATVVQQHGSSRLHTRHPRLRR